MHCEYIAILSLNIHLTATGISENITITDARFYFKPEMCIADCQNKYILYCYIS